MALSAPLHADDVYAEIAALARKRVRNAALRKTADCILTLLLTPIYALWQGIVLSTLWAWFAVPLGFRSVPAFYAVGLVIIFRYALPVNLMYGHGSPKIYDPKRSLLAQSFTLFGLAPAAVLGLGWCWKWLGWGL